MNRHAIIGRLGKDPELSYTQAGLAVARFSVATETRWTDKDGNRQSRTDWHNVVAWRKAAETIAQYAKKGDRIFIAGASSTRKWEDNSGNTRYTTEITVDEFEFLESKREGEPTKEPAPAEQRSSAPSPAAAPESGNDDLPF